MAQAEALEFDPSDPAFLADPYPALNRLRESTPGLLRRRARPLVRHPARGRPRLPPGQAARPELPPRDVAGGDRRSARSTPAGRRSGTSERWSLLWLEPPDHTRIRKLVAAAFTPRSVEALREPAHELARELLEPLAEAGEMELLYDYAQPYSIAVICRMLGVPLDRHRDLLDWSHRMVKMYEFDVPLEAATAANQAAAEFQDYVRGADPRAAGAIRATTWSPRSSRRESTAGGSRTTRSSAR